MNDAAASERIGVLSIDHEAQLVARPLERELFQQAMKYIQAGLPAALQSGTEELRVDVTEAVRELPWEIVDGVVGDLNDRFPAIREEFDRSGEGVSISLTGIQGVKAGKESSVTVRLVVSVDNRRTLEELRKADG